MFAHIVSLLLIVEHASPYNVCAGATYLQLALLGSPMVLHKYLMISTWRWYLPIHCVSFDVYKQNVKAG